MLNVGQVEWTWRMPKVRYTLTFYRSVTGGMLHYHYCGECKHYLLASSSQLCTSERFVGYLVMWILKTSVIRVPATSGRSLFACSVSFDISVPLATQLFAEVLIDTHVPSASRYADKSALSMQFFSSWSSS